MENVKSVWSDVCRWSSYVAARVSMSSVVVLPRLHSFAWSLVDRARAWIERDAKVTRWSNRFKEMICKYGNLTGLIDFNTMQQMSRLWMWEVGVCSATERVLGTWSGFILFSSLATPHLRMAVDVKWEEKVRVRQLKGMAKNRDSNIVAEVWLATNRPIFTS